VARTPLGVARLVELAELLQAPVQDMRFTLRMNFPSRHPLKLGPAVPVTEADVILGLEHPEFFQNLHTQTPTNRMGMETRPNFKPGTKIATISASDLLTKSNYQDVGRYIEADLTIPADTEATLPAPIEAFRNLITPDRQRGCTCRCPSACIRCSIRSSPSRPSTRWRRGWRRPGGSIRIAPGACAR